VETTIKDFEAAIAELESIVKKLEEGDAARTIAAYERGVQLALFYGRLEEAERRIEIHTGRAAGQQSVARRRRRVTATVVTRRCWADEARSAVGERWRVGFGRSGVPPIIATPRAAYSRASGCGV
jgi:exodeoxyribonuclease VII small subunit